MALNIIDVCEIKYPGEIEKGNITFRKPGENVLIDNWNVPNTPKPLESDLQAEIIQYQDAIKLKRLKGIALDIIFNLLNNTAYDRGYKNSLDCISYYHSTNATKELDAQTFINWRDAVWNVYDQVLADFENGVITQPSKQEFIAMLPLIEWP